MVIFNYSVMESLKDQCQYLDSEKDRDLLRDFAHWHRFLSTVVTTKPKKDGTIHTEFYKPPVSFTQYRQWKRDYPGWSYGSMSRTHAAWKDKYISCEKPMNKFSA